MRFLVSILGFLSLLSGVICAENAPAVQNPNAAAPISAPASAQVPTAQPISPTAAIPTATPAAPAPTTAAPAAVTPPPAPVAPVAAAPVATAAPTPAPQAAPPVPTAALQQPAASAQPSATATVSNPVQVLMQKLQKREGGFADVVVFAPLDETKNKVGKVVTNTVVSALQSFGNIPVRGESEQLTTLTLEHFRLMMARHKADILIGLVTRDSNFNIYLYDRRSPYAVFAHSEMIPEANRGNLNEKVAADFTVQLTKKLLMRYIYNQYFELPREQSLPVLQSEVPKWVATEESLASLNREYTSRYYASLLMGAALSMGTSRQVWNSNLVGGQIGIRIVDRLFAEGSAMAFSYNAFTLSMKYVFMNRTLPFQVSPGLGFSFVSRDKTWSLDQTPGLGRYTYYYVPSMTLLWPIGDVYLKLDTQLHVGVGFNKFILIFSPGISFYF